MIGLIHQNLCVDSLVMENSRTQIFDTTHTAVAVFAKSDLCTKQAHRSRTSSAAHTGYQLALRLTFLQTQQTAVGKIPDPCFVYKTMSTCLGTTKRVFPDAPTCFIHKARIGYFFFPGRTCAVNSPHLSWGRKYAHDRHAFCCVVVKRSTWGLNYDKNLKLRLQSGFSVTPRAYESSKDS